MLCKKISHKCSHALLSNSGLCVGTTGQKIDGMVFNPHRICDAFLLAMEMTGGGEVPGVLVGSKAVNASRC